MTDIKIVTGLNYGDESKGLVANTVSTSSSLTILASNSCQRGHTVVEGGIRHIFRHFGTATIKGAANYFTEKFYVNPAMFRKEFLELQKLGVAPKVFAREGSIIITPMDMFASIEVEHQVGENRHTTTGMGVWQGLRRHKNAVGMTLGNNYTYCNGGLIKDYYLNFFKENGKLNDNVFQFYNGEHLCDNFYNDLHFFLDNVTLIKSDEEEKELLRSYPLIVFENSQGLLLDDDYNMDIDHNTPAHVGTMRPREVIERVFKPDEAKIEAMYVTRTYLTRHGKGDMQGIECNKADINPDMFDKTNTWNFGQGGLRYAKFNDSAAEGLIMRATGDNRWFASGGYWQRPSIVITHTNEYNDGVLEEEVRRNKELLFKIYTSDNEETIKEEK